MEYIKVNNNREKIVILKFIKSKDKVINMVTINAVKDINKAFIPVTI